MNVDGATGNEPGGKSVTGIIRRCVIDRSIRCGWVRVLLLALLRQLTHTVIRGDTYQGDYIRNCTAIKMRHPQQMLPNAKPDMSFVDAFSYIKKIYTTLPF